MKSASRQLSLGSSANGFVEMLRVFELLIQECLGRFVSAVLADSKRSIWEGSQQLTRRILWKSILNFASLQLWFCRTVQAANYNVGLYTISTVLSQTSGSGRYLSESWCDDKLCIWRLMYGFPCAMNNLNTLDFSTLFPMCGPEQRPYFSNGMQLVVGH